jgi:hypothetical protein
MKLAHLTVKTAPQVTTAPIQRSLSASLNLKAITITALVVLSPSVKPTVLMDTTTTSMDLIQMMTAGSVLQATSVPTMPQIHQKRFRFALKAITVLQV